MRLTSRLYRKIYNATDLVEGCNYHLFREGINPKWEDPQNEKGGRWIHYCERQDNKQAIETKWLDTMLSCIGESLPSSEEVKGCVFNSKRGQVRISLWLGDITKLKEVKMIGCVSRVVVWTRRSHPAQV